MLQVALHSPRQHRQFEQQDGAVLLARAEAAESLWTTVDRDRSSSAQALVTIVPEDNGVRLELDGCEQECVCARRCKSPGRCQLALPARFSIGDTRFEVVVDGGEPSGRSLDVLNVDRASGASSPSERGPSPATLSRWFDAVGTLQRWASSAQELFTKSARCAVETIGLDGAVVLRRRDEVWEIAASHLPHPELGIHCDTAALDQLLDAPRTLFHGTEAAAGGDVAVVVSPLVSADQKLVGAIYGFRSTLAENSRRGIRYLEAHLIELLAGAVNDGMQRIEHEAEVERHRVLREQSIVGSTDLHADPPASQRREVTLLFADLRQSSEISQALGSGQTYALLADVMNVLSAAVLDHDGMIIDYYGDGLAAMWNAPADQPDHPELACRAALRMQETLPAVGKRWAHVLVDPLRLGVGVHTGVTQVGNAGSQQRTKYGPRGQEVHVASRVEAATKPLGVPLLVTGAAAARLSNQLSAYRLCRVRLAGIGEPVDLYGVGRPAADRFVRDELARYQLALAAFEAGHLNDAAAHLATLAPDSTWLPAKFLAAEIERARGKQQGRRSSDGGKVAVDGVITIGVK